MVTFDKCCIILLTGLLLQSHLFHYGEGVGEIEHQNNEVKTPKQPFEQLIPSGNSDSSKESSSSFSKADEAEIAKERPAPPPYITVGQSVATNLKTKDDATNRSSATLSTGDGAFTAAEASVATATLSAVADKSEKKLPALVLTGTDGDNESKTRNDKSQEEGEEEKDNNRKSNKIETVEKSTISSNVKFDEEGTRVKMGENELTRPVESDAAKDGITNSTDDDDDAEKESNEESTRSRNEAVVDDSGERNVSSSARTGKIRNFQKPWLSSTERFQRPPDEFFSRPTSFKGNSDDWQPINGHGQKRPQGFTVTTESPSETEILKRIVTGHTGGPRIATNPSFKRKLASSTSTESMPLYSSASSSSSLSFFPSVSTLPINAAVRKPSVVNKPTVSPGSNRRKVPIVAPNDPSLPTTSTAWALATLKSHTDKFSRRPPSDSVAKKNNNITFLDAGSRKSTTIKPFVSWSTRLQKPVVFEQNDGVKVSTSSAADEQPQGDSSVTTVSYVTELEHIVVNNTASSSSTAATNKLDTGETGNGNDDTGNGSSPSTDNVNYYNTSSGKWSIIKDNVSGDLLRITSASPEIINGSSQSTISTINFQSIFEQTEQNQLSNNSNNDNNNDNSNSSNNNSNSSNNNSNSSNNDSSSSSSSSSSNRQQNTEPIMVQDKRNQSLTRNFENQSLSIKEEEDSFDNVNRNVVEREEQQLHQVLSYELNNGTTPPTAIQNDVLVIKIGDTESLATTENIFRNFSLSKNGQFKSNQLQSEKVEMELPAFTKTDGLSTSTLVDENPPSGQNETRNQLWLPSSQNLIEPNKLEDGETSDIKIVARPAEATEKNLTVINGRPDYHDKSPVTTRDSNVIITANTINPSLVITSDDGKNTLIKIDLPAKEVIMPKNGSSNTSNRIPNEPPTEAASAISSSAASTMDNRNETKSTVSVTDIVKMSTNQLQTSDNDNGTVPGGLSDVVVDEKLHIQNNEDAILSNEVSSTLKPFPATSEDLPAVVAPTEIAQDVDYQQPTYVTNVRDNDLSIPEVYSRKNASIPPNETFTASISWNTSTVSAIPNISRFTVVANPSTAGPMLEFPDTVINYSSSTPAYTLHQNATSTPNSRFIEIIATSTTNVPTVTTMPDTVFSTLSTAVTEKVTFSSHSSSSIVPEYSSSRNSFTKVTDNGIDTSSKSVISSIRTSSTSFTVRTSQSSSSSSASTKSPITFSPPYDVTLSSSTVIPSKNSSSEGENKTKKYIFSHQHPADIPAYFDIVFKTSAKHLCHLSHFLLESMSRYITSRSSKSLSPEQIIMVVDPNQCKNPDDSTQLISVTMYVLDDDQAVLAELKKILHTEEVNLTLPIHKITFHEDSRLSNETRNIAVVGVACMVILSFAMIFFLIWMIRNRQKGVYGQRCTPVSMDDYSLDNISVYNSARRKSKLRASRRSYGNPAFEDPSVPSRPLTYNGLLKAIGSKSELDEEFSQIPTVVVKPDELPPGAEAKNRYSNVIPLPETRVSLSTNKNNSEIVHSYINANYVKGFKGQDKFYIACQAPLQSTIEDFWKMIWKEQSKVIVMLTALVENGVEKCADYLPPSEVLDCHRLFGDFQITLKKREVREKYVMSSLQLKNMENNLWREITHFWYTNWPLQGVPAEQNSIIAMILEARSYMRNNTGPLIVHCSPGTGRTGTVIVCDICIREYEQSKTVNIPATVSMLRRCRAGSVQTKDQYSFIYKVLALYAKKLNDSGSLDSI